MVATGAGPAASAADMPALVGASERLVEAYIELAMVGLMALRLARFWLRLPFFVFVFACIAPVMRRVEGEEKGLLCRGRGQNKWKGFAKESHARSRISRHSICPRKVAQVRLYLPSFKFGEGEAGTARGYTRYT